MRLSEVDPGLAEDWIALWNECEMQRYGAVSGNLESLAERLRSLAQNRNHMGMTKLHITLSLGLAMLASTTLLAQAEQMFEAANEAYEAGNHQLALDTYESILRITGISNRNSMRAMQRSSWVSLARPGCTTSAPNCSTRPTTTFRRTSHCWRPKLWTASPPSPTLGSERGCPLGSGQVNSWDGWFGLCCGGPPPGHSGA